MKKYLNIILAFAVLVVVAVVQGAIEMEGVVGAMAIAAYTKACSKNVGGNSAVYLTEAANLSSVTVVSGEITAALSMSGTTTFKEVQADLDSVLHTQEGEGSQNNIAYTHRVEMRFAKPSVGLNTLRNALADASPCGVLAIVTDGNGRSWLVGYNETDGTNRALYLATDSLNSGQEPAEEDSQAITIALECQSGYLSLPFDSTIGATITGGSAAFITYV